MLLFYQPLTYIFCLTPVPLIDMVDYTKLVGFKTIQGLADDNEIDTVYVRFADENEDRMLDCAKPTNMNTLRDIITSRDPIVVGWRLHHHHREEKNEKVARSLMERVSTKVFAIRVVVCM